MPTLDDVARIALELPEVVEGQRREGRAWSVGGTVFVWERLFSAADIRRFGDEPTPSGPILGVRVADLTVKEAILDAGRRGVFTIPHFDGYAGVLVRLRAVGPRVLRDLIEEGWMASAPRRLVEEFRSR